MWSWGVTMPVESSIEAHNLTKIFKLKSGILGPEASIPKRKESVTVTAVNHLDLEIKKGELFGLLGPNGAGKTTLVKILCTLLPPDEGSAVVNGFDIIRQQMDVRRSIATLFSVGDRGFFWRLNGYRNLEFYAAIYNVPRSRRRQAIMRVLGLVGLENRAFEIYQKYSGGMRRKLSLARALLPDAPTLLLDEPTVGLDVPSSRSLREFIKKTLSKELGKTVLYTTHYVEEAAQICDRVGIMNKGKLIACGSPDVIRDMTKKSEAVNIAVDSITDAQMAAIGRISGVVSVTPFAENSLPNQRSLRLQLESLESLPLVFDFLLKEGIRLMDLKREETTLEDAFMKLTGEGTGY
jgi:ABC-2 type transport system ATP-binding protein